MRFTLFMMPSIPCTPEERASLRPIVQQSDKVQQMLRDIVELARIAEDLGFEIVATTEHHLHEEGLEMGGTAALHYHIAANTNHVKVGPIGYVLPAWNPLRLAVEIAWLDQLTKGRAIVGMARGYQTRWFNNMAQKYGAQATHSSPTGGNDASLGTARIDDKAADDLNRAAFHEVFEILQLAWRDEPFSYDGKFWKYPIGEGGTDWPAASWTERFGTPGVLKNGKLQKINITPKPFQKPHPELFTAFSSSEATITWAAAHGVVPTITTTTPERFGESARLYHEAAKAAGKDYALGDHISTARLIAIGNDREDAMRVARNGQAKVYYKEFGGGFGFWEGFRFPEDEDKYPRGVARLPESEWTVERLERSGHLLAGTVGDIRRGLDATFDVARPEHYQYSCPQGYVPFEESVRQLRFFGEQIMPHYR